jgi:PAS domain S-box-containing protein
MNSPELGFKSGKTQDWLAAKGEFAERIRTLDWARTPLGDRDHWSPALRFAANLCFSCATPVAVIWGESCSTLYNESYGQLMGRSPESGQGLGFDELWPEAWAGNKISINQIILNQQSVVPWKARITSFDLAYNPIYQEDGRTGGVFLLVQDVTEDLERRRNEELVKQVNQVARLGYIDLNIVTNQVTLSDEALEILGFPKGSNRMGHEELTRHIHPADKEVVGKSLEGAIAGRTKHDMDHRMVRPDGNVAYVRATAQLFRDMEGKPVRLLGTVHDVTDRIQAKEALEDREQRLRLALDASSAGVWTWDPFTNQSRWDDRFHAQYGFGEGAPQTFDTWISGVHEEDRPNVLAHLDDVLHRHQNEWNIVFRAVRPDGTVRWMHGLGRADRAADGQVIRMSGINLDITERRRAEEILQARREEERDRALHREAEEALRRSHAELEQRTLQLSRLASQLTLAEQSVREQLARTLHDGLQQQLFTAALALDRAVNSDSQADQQDLLQKAHAGINEAVEAARTLSVNLFPPILHTGGLPMALSWLGKRTQEQYGLVVSVTADPQANPTAHETRILLFEAVRELLFNAVKHARVHRVDVNLATGPDDTIHVQVSDEGAGFDPTVTLHRGAQHEPGLGLFSIQERLALLGGHLDIQSAPGKGSRFTLTLARTGLSRLATYGTESQSRDTGQQGKLGHELTSRMWNSLRILIADDHPVVRAGLRELLHEHTELQVVGEAANGLEAISQAMALQPDVIVMDVSMPQMNGIQATRAIHSTLPNIQIVGLSTYSDETTERAILDAGAHAYFAKTETTHRLVDYLLSVLARAKGFR